jgi:hypothetical protein
MTQKENPWFRDIWDTDCAEHEDPTTGLSDAEIVEHELTVMRQRREATAQAEGK